MIAPSRAVIALVACALAAPARAQTAEAEVLFREGRQLLADGDFAAACAKLEASERLDAAIGTELNLADCFDRAGKPASAWAMFAKAEQTAKRRGDTKRAVEARRRGSELVSKLVYLTVAVADDHQLDGLVIERDGTRVDRVLWNQRMVLDPGNYKLAASAPGHLTWRATIALSENRTIEVPALERAPIENPFPAAAESHPEPDPDVQPQPPPEPRPLRFTAATISLAVVGLGAIAAGAGFGDISQELVARARCDSAGCATPLAVDENHRARRDAFVADGAFVAGGLAIATSAVLWLVGWPARAEHVSVVPLARGAGLAVGGHF
ncbi:MAG TPA: hypothetical protein VH143_08205 [Kofleriaceae bacterium]|jgi:serine/threonine-protein kinase|nr:hypothetical protein [Kofleriaceae bacterium]